MSKEVVTEENKVAEKLTDWKNEPTLDNLARDRADALSDHNAQVNTINKYLDALAGKLKHTPAKNRSHLQPKLLRKQAEWRYSSLESPFLETADLLNIDPISADDRPLADQISAVLNNQMTIQQDLVGFYNAYVRDLVDTGTAIIKVGWKYEEVQESVDVPTYLEDPYSGEYMLDENEEPIENGFTTEMQTKVIQDKPIMEIVDFESVVIDPTCNGKIENAKFVIEKYTSSLAELKADGSFRNLDKIVFEDVDEDSTDDSLQPFKFEDDPRKRLEIIEYWGEWDIDGSGVTKPIVATWTGRTLIKLEENPYPDGEHPFVVVQYLPVKNKIAGEPDGVLIESDQDILGAVTRGMIDIMARSSNGQVGVRSDAMSTSDFLKYQNNEDFRFNPGMKPSDIFFHGSYPEISNSAYQMIQMANQNAESITGIQAFNQGMNGSGLGDTATSVQTSLNAAAKRELGILRRMTAGIKKVARKFNAMNAEFLTPEQVSRITGKEFVQFDKNDMSGKLDVRFSISTAEEDNTKASELSFMLQTIGQTIEPDMRNLILSMIARLRKLPDLALKLEQWQPPKPDPLAVKERELTVQKLEAELAKLKRDEESEGANKILIEAKALLERVKADKMSSEKDLSDVEYLDRVSGKKRNEEIEDQEKRYNSKS